MTFTENEAEIFAGTLRKASKGLRSFEFKVGTLVLAATIGPLSENFHYGDEEWQLLGREFEYEITWDGCRIPFEVRLHLNERNQWKLMGFADAGGQLFQINLSNAPRRDNDKVIILQERIKIAAQKETVGSEFQNMNKMNRDKVISWICKERRSFAQGFLVDEEINTVILGSFDLSGNGRFLDTSAEHFIKDFTKVCIIKGNFMGKNTYELNLS